MDALKNIAQTLWVGGLWVVGVLVAPALFGALPHNRALAGELTGQVLQAMAFVGMGCAAVLIVHAFARHGFTALKTAAFWLVMGMLACTVINHFAVFPLLVTLKTQASQAAQGVFGGGFGSWHAISTLIYSVQGFLGLALIVKDAPAGKK